ncbi:Valencene synthase [Melia azedarach]|uniref:Valencene synthase n=1 Tax=Melia azedarach TaxID=155640 RepID=A0ACC1X423_MELAZ|nr:Valencene synthase [Melia azedarach]
MTSQYEQKRGHIASAVECYMKQYGVSEEEAVNVLKQEDANAWKDINEEFIVMNNNNPSWIVPFPLLESILNLTQDLIEMYFAQAKWFNEGYIPTSMEEYTSIAFESIGTTMLIANCYLFMGDLATEDAYKWILKNPKIVTATSIAVRLMDDIAGHEFEQKRGHIASAVECYMKQYSVSKEEAVKVLKQEVANAWKDMNEGFILMSNNNNPSWAVSFPLLESILNFVRACDFIYKDGERYTHPYLMKDQIASVLKDPMIL